MNRDAKTLLAFRHRSKRPILPEMLGRERKPGYRRDDRDLGLSRLGELTQPIFDKDAVAWLRRIGIER